MYLPNHFKRYYYEKKRKTIIYKLRNDLGINDDDTDSQSIEIIKCKKCYGDKIVPFKSFLKDIITKETKNLNLSMLV